jgi:hypothetical protein
VSNTIKFSEYNEGYISIDGEIICVDVFKDNVADGEHEEAPEAFAVTDAPVFGECIDSEWVFTSIHDRLYDEVGNFEWDNEEAAKRDLTELLNQWAATHLNGTVRVATPTRVDVSELFDVTDEEVERGAV